MKKALLLVAALLVVSAAHANLVVNGGFETGDFTGWTLSGNPGYIGIVTDPVHSGTFAASFGAVGFQTMLAQTLVPTTPGSSYLIDFWLKNDYGPGNLFTVDWNGSTIFTQGDSQSFDWTEYTFTVSATATSTPLAFGFRQDPSFFQFDDVSVTPVPEPTTMIAGALLLLPFGASALRSLRKNRTA